MTKKRHKSACQEFHNEILFQVKPNLVIMNIKSPSSNNYSYKPLGIFSKRRICKICDFPRDMPFVFCTNKEETAR